VREVERETCFIHCSEALERPLVAAAREIVVEAVKLSRQKGNKLRKQN
jgi:F420-dependent methylenetetrahydromethanopterin dehydrogenase